MESRIARTKSAHSRWWVVHPRRCPRALGVWDAIAALALMYVALATPYEVRPSRHPSLRRATHTALCTVCACTDKLHMQVAFLQHGGRAGALFALNQVRLIPPRGRERPLVAAPPSPSHVPHLIAPRRCVRFARSVCPSGQDILLRHVQVTPHRVPRAAAYRPNRADTRATLRAACGQGPLRDVWRVSAAAGNAPPQRRVALANLACRSAR